RSERHLDARPLTNSRAMRSASTRPVNPPDGLGTAVQEIVTTLLPEGQPPIRSVARMVRLSARVLQRRLSDEGLTFVRVVARARLEAAQRLLDDPSRKVIDIALDLGYSDPAHFTRAFVRWTGLAPRDFRRLRSVGCAEPADPDLQ